MLPTWALLLLQIQTLAAASPVPSGWSMVERFAGLRFEVRGKVQGVYFRQGLVAVADQHACFGWVQNTAHGTVVGEARCDKHTGAPAIRKYLREGSAASRVDGVNILEYPDTKIRYHFSHFKVVEDSRSMCFDDDGPHSCGGGAGGGEHADVVHNEL